jgi:hypothetical protein
LGVGYCREGGLLGEKCFEGLPRGVRGTRKITLLFIELTGCAWGIENLVPLSMAENSCCIQTTTHYESLAQFTKTSSRLERAMTEYDFNI